MHWFRDQICKILYVTPWKNFAFYFRSHILHYNEYTNSVHERTNNALRSSSVEIGPSIQINKSYEKIVSSITTNLFRKDNHTDEIFIETKYTPV